METLKKLAVFDTSEPTLEATKQILETAGILGTPTADDIEGLVAVVRGALHHIMVDHSGGYQSTQIKTPFMAWRTRELIAEALLSTELVEVNPDGPDTSQQCAEFRAGFNTTELVLWNSDIWKAAIRNAEEVFEGKPITAEMINAAIPMFWQFETALVLNSDVHELFELQGRDYTCVGLVIMPTVEDFLRVELPKDSKAIKERYERSGATYVTIDSTKPHSQPVLRAFEKALEADITLARRGISVSIIFLPRAGEMIPEIRTMPAVFEGETIKGPLRCSILAGLNFLTQKFVVKDKVGVSKKELKADRQLFKAVRKGKTQVPPIKIINLRRAERKEKSDEGEGGEPRAKRVLTCHSLVSSHWKNQWYPAEGVHKPIYILTYVRGDTSKPFRPPRPKIYKAVR